MARRETNPAKIEKSYYITKARKFFRKARAIVIKDGKLLLIKMLFNDGRVHYLLPGGGVEDGEAIKDTILRETLEEYNAAVKILKYLDKQYYNIDLEFNGEKFVSHRVEYYYLCEFENFVDGIEMGVGDEFVSNEKTYSKVELALDEVLKLRAKDINGMSEKTYAKLVDYVKSIQ